MKSNRLFEQDGFSVIVALEPPKGTDLSAFQKMTGRLKGRVQAVLVNDGADGIMRMTPLAACLAANKDGLRAILGMNARDRNRIAIQGDLLGASQLGVEEVFIEKGKDPSYGDHPLTRPIADIDCRELAHLIAKLNEGRDLAGQKLKGSTELDLGAQVEWLDDEQSVDLEFTRMEALVKEGVRAFVTSPQFDLEKTKARVARAKALGVKVYVGVMILKSVGMARYLNEVPGVSRVPDAVIEQMVNAPVKPKAGIEIAAGFMKALKGVADGVVLMPVGWEHKVPAVLDAYER
jgi:5,10-methylenetetrahydrofolate reductase